MDMHLPVIDGLEAIRRIRRSAENPDDPIIAFSADAFLEQQELAFDSGATDYLIKPLDFAKLYPVLRMYLQHEITDDTSQHVPDPIPPGVDREIRSKLETICETPPYQSAQIVNLAEEIIESCGEYVTDYRVLAEQIRQHVYSNKTHQIPTLIMDQLQRYTKLSPVCFFCVGWAH